MEKDGQNRLILLQCLQLVMWNINEKFVNAVLSEKFASLVLHIIYSDEEVTYCIIQSMPVSDNNFLTKFIPDIS